jgi:hypothetical protein
MKGEIYMSKVTERPKLLDNVRRIPCRGCVANCIFISKCEGKPWRMSDSTIALCREQIAKEK